MAKQKGDSEVAAGIVKFLAKHDAAHTATVAEIAEALDADTDTVERVLDEHTVSENGRVTHHGPGRGGGWSSPPQEDDES